VHDLYIFSVPVSSVAMLIIQFLLHLNLLQDYFNNYLYYKYSFYNNVLDHE